MELISLKIDFEYDDWNTIDFIDDVIKILTITLWNQIFVHINFRLKETIYIYFVHVLFRWSIWNEDSIMLKKKT